MYSTRLASVVLTIEESNRSAKYTTIQGEFSKQNDYTKFKTTNAYRKGVSCHLMDE
jgi:hypothetical protein